MPRLTPKLLAEAEHENRLRDFMLATPGGKVQHALELAGRPMSPLEISRGTGLSDANVRKILGRLLELDWPPGVKRVGYGSYQFEKPVAPPSRTSYTSVSKADKRCMAYVGRIPGRT